MITFAVRIPKKLILTMNPKPIKEKDKGWFSAASSRTVLLFHGILLVAIVVVWGVLNVHIS